MCRAQVLALDTHEIFALKRIRLHRSDRSTIASYKDEIDILTSLRGHPNIIHMVDSLIDMESKQIFVVMESGEIVLTKWLQREQDKKRKADKLRADGAAGGGGDGSGSDDYSDDEPTTPLASCAVDANMLRMIWLQMVSAVQTIHDARIVHGDLKSANFVFVEGTLKLIDFGIAKTIGNDTTNIVRDSTVRYVCVCVWRDRGVLLALRCGDADSGCGHCDVAVSSRRNLLLHQPLWCYNMMLFRISR
jgi:serine/threonine-protein kinase TTK/MPS1